MIDFGAEEIKLDQIFWTVLYKPEGDPSLFYLDKLTPDKTQFVLTKVKILFIKCDTNEIERAYQLVSILAKKHKCKYLEEAISQLKEDAMKNHSPLPDLPRSDALPQNQPQTVQQTEIRTTIIKVRTSSLMVLGKIWIIVNANIIAAILGGLTVSLIMLWICERDKFILIWNRFFH
jgi:hypothetical protein